MTKEEIVRFISNNYADGEELVWQVVNQEDILADDNEWSKFVEHTTDNSELADILSQVIQDYYYQWLENSEDSDEYE
jgi:hypothetical protein